MSTRLPRQYVSLLLSVLLLIGVLAGTSLSQVVSSSISGRVLDPGGSVIVGARLVATNIDTNISFTEQSDSSGNYQFSDLTAGHYTVRIEAPGFKTTEIRGLTLQVDQKASIDVNMELGQTSTKVEVNEAAPLVESQTASIGTVITEKDVVDLPLNLRRFGQLATLVPGTVPITAALLRSRAVRHSVRQHLMRMAHGPPATTF